MLFDYEITVPPATPKFTPERVVCKLTSGKLQEVRITFPPGPATLVYITVLDQLHQIVPVNPDGAINKDDITVISSNLGYKLTAPFECLIEGWSPDAYYSHTIGVQFEVYPDDEDQNNAFSKMLEYLSPKKRK